MLNLILKDILIQRRSFLIGFTYSLFILFIFKSNTFAQENGKFIIGVVSIAYIFATYSIEYDEKNNCHSMLNSLPLRRKEIVLAKYLSLAVYNVIGILIMMITGIVSKVVGFDSVSYTVDLKSIVYVFAAIFLLFAIFYPLYFKISYSKTRYINTFLYLSVIFVPSCLDYLFKNIKGDSNLKFLLEMILNKSDMMQQALFLIAVIIITTISFFISVRNYTAKNF